MVQVRTSRELVIKRLRLFSDFLKVNTGKTCPEHSTIWNSAKYDVFHYEMIIIIMLVISFLIFEAHSFYTNFIQIAMKSDFWRSVILSFWYQNFIFRDLIIEILSLTKNITKISIHFFSFYSEIAKFHIICLPKACYKRWFSVKNWK